MIVALQTLVFFRHSLLKALDRFLRPYYRKFFLAISNKNEDDSEEEDDDHVFAVYDEEKGVVFYPPMYLQRYAAISDCLLDERWRGKLDKVVDLGYHDMSFIKYLKDVPGIKQILGVDLEIISLSCCSSDLFEEYTPKRENPLRITLFQGNAADPDYRLRGCDAVVAIEMIEHMLPHDLERLVHTVFGFIKPWVAIFTTPNADFNVLFKSLEKNNYRRLDHLFEWSREQFNDWCSNIVVRYPDYTVNSKGIGPGPSGTLHLGCCSQMAVFVAKTYQKQQDLDPNSLALIDNAPEMNILNLMNWDSHDSLTEINLNNQTKESSELLVSEPSSHHSVMFASAMSTRNHPGFRDVIAQCNLEREIAKNFLMFEGENDHHIVVPRKKNYYRVYLMEDVARRLNCSTFQVKKFSRTTQDLMAKNKMDYPGHTKEVFNEIKQLTSMLNLKKPAIKSSGDTTNIWYNINWGENAPYWNQYYKIVRDYSYPFETKSDETRILDLIYEELNRLIDMQYENESCTEPGKLEIPIEHLMKRVQHITTDVDKVKDLLDWNGYEIDNDVVVHTRLMMNNKSSTSIDEDWLENDILSDYDTNMDSTTDGCFNLQSMPDRSIRRAIDQKVAKLRSMMTTDEDITSELDRVVCRLMKLALRTSRGHQTPSPSKWMHCKLFDLLTLTEKTIERRRRHFLTNYSLKAISYDHEGEENDKADLAKIEGDKAGLELVDKYSYIVNKPVNPEIEDPLYDEEVSQTSTENTKGNDLIVPEGMSILVHWRENHIKCSGNLDRTETWVNEDAGLVQYLKEEKDNYAFCDADIEQRISNDSHNFYCRSHRKCKPSIKYCTHLNKSSYKSLSSKCKSEHKDTNRQKQIKKVVYTKLNNNPKGNAAKITKTNFSNFKLSRSKINRPIFQPNVSKPIPGSLIKLCSPKYDQDTIMKKNSPTISDISKRETEVKVSEMNESYDHNEECHYENNSKITDLSQKTETEIETDLVQIRKVIKDPDQALLGIQLTHIKSDTIFLNDINEPSTSKGVTHVCMDVQCGPDVTSSEYLKNEIDTSHTHLGNEVEMGECIVNTVINSADFGTSMSRHDKFYRTLVPRIKSIGIKIKDSDLKFCESNNRSTITDQTANITSPSKKIQPPSICASDLTNETDLFNVILNKSKPDCASKLNTKASDIFNFINEGADNIEAILSSAPKPVETNLANCLMSRLKLCYSGIRIRSFKSKQEYQDAFPEKNSTAAQLLSEQPTPTVQSKTNSRNLKHDAKTNSINPKEPKRIKSYGVTVKNTFQIHNRKQNSLHKNELNENRTQKKEVQIRNPKLTITKPKPSNEIYVSTQAHAAQSSSRQSRQNVIIIKGQSKKGLSSDQLKNKPNIQKKPKKEVRNLKNTQDIINIPASNNLKQHIYNNKINVHNLNKSVDTVQCNNKLNKPKTSTLRRAKTEEIKSNLSKIQPQVFSEFYVYQNETKSSKMMLRPTPDPSVRSSSPQSVESSTCSSPSSIQTVKLRPKSSPNSHSKIRVLSPDSKSITSIRSKKSAKNFRRFSVDKYDGNKENDVDRSLSSEKSFLGNNAKVFVAKLSGTPLQSTENSLVKRKSSKSVKIPEIIDDQRDTYAIKKRSSKSNKFEQIQTLDVDFISHDNSFIDYPRSSTPVNEEEHNLNDICQMLENSMTNSYSIDVITSLLGSLVESSLGITDSFDDSQVGVDTRTIILEQDDYIDDCFDDSLSLSHGSVKTAVENLDSIKEHDEECDPNSTYNTVVERDFSKNTLHMVPEAEVLTFPPTNSLTGSPRNTSLIKNNPSASQTHRKESILDLYERKNALLLPAQKAQQNNIVTGSYYQLQIWQGNKLTVTDWGWKQHQRGIIPKLTDKELIPEIMLNTIFCSRETGFNSPHYINANVGPLALQAFSGFSVNTEPIPGDQLDYVNQIDSETENNDVNRQATSEELFVSGRSSVTYETCSFDEETVIPEWLFRIVNQQQMQPEEVSELGPAMLPIAEPMYDMNGNAVEPAVGSEAGAGDGRGVHSDMSQDSSGQGSSITSSDTSSGPHSEAMLIDPSVLTEQYNTALPLQFNSDSARSTQESSGNVDPPRSSREVHHDTMALLGASDADADESSLDTDA